MAGDRNPPARARSPSEGRAGSAGHQWGRGLRADVEDGVHGGRWRSITVCGWCRSPGRGQCPEQVQQLVPHSWPCPAACRVFSAHRRGRPGGRCASPLQPASRYLKPGWPGSRAPGSAHTAVQSGDQRVPWERCGCRPPGQCRGQWQQHMGRRAQLPPRCPPWGVGGSFLVGSCWAGGSCQPEAAIRWGQEGLEFRSRLLAMGVLWLARGPPPQTGGMPAASSGSLVPLPGYRELGPQLFLPVPFLQAAWHRGTRDGSQGLGGRGTEIPLPAPETEA